MATVAGVGGERMLLRRRQRLTLGDLTNLSAATSVLTRVKPSARPKPRTSPSAGSSTSSIGSCFSAAATIRFPPPPSVVTTIKAKDKPTREVQSSTCPQKKIKMISKRNVKTGDMLPGASSRPSKKTRKVYQVTREKQTHMEPLDQSSGEPLPSQDFIHERRAYFAEIDAFKLMEEFVSSGSDLD